MLHDEKNRKKNRPCKQLFILTGLKISGEPIGFQKGSSQSIVNYYLDETITLNFTGFKFAGLTSFYLPCYGPENCRCPSDKVAC